MRVVWILCVPVIYGSIVLIMYTLYVKIKGKKFNTYHIFNACMFFLIYTQPGTISELLKAMTCRKIGNKSYITADLTYDCNTE